MRVLTVVRWLSRVAQPVALVAALVLVVVLARQNSQLRSEVFDNKMLAKAPKRNSVLPGFHTRTLAGDSALIARGSTEVLFFFTATCLYCKKTLPAWETIAARVGHTPLRVYGIAGGSDSVIRAYAAEHGIHFSVVEFPDTLTEMAYHIGAVPLTLVFWHLPL